MWEVMGAQARRILLAGGWFNQIWHTIAGSSSMCILCLPHMSAAVQSCTAMSSPVHELFPQAYLHGTGLLM